jgi:hypothetical protein
VSLSNKVERFPLLLDFLKSTLNFVFLSSDFTCVVDSFSMSDEVLLDKYFVKCECFAFRVAVNVIFEFSPMPRSDERFSKEVNQRKNILEIFNGLFD